MNSGTPNKEILLLSPASIKYSSRSKQLLDDEGDPPHINNHLIMRSQMKYQTPVKREEGTLIKTEFQDSSRKKGIKDSLSSSKNPFNRFEDEQISPLEKEAPSLRKEAEVIAIESPKIQSKKNIVPKSSKKIWESPQKQLRNFAIRQSKIEIGKISFQEEYNKTLEEISNNPRSKITLPFFFIQSSQLSAGKLICFELNPKNGRIVRYNTRERTCLPSFRCFGCGREFQIASALGGHLSKCREKEEHFEVLQNHSGDFDFDLYMEESLEKKVKKRKQKSKKKLVRKICRGKHVMKYKVIGRKSRMIIRGTYPRMAKQRACMKIRQSLVDVIQDNLD